MYEYLSTIKLVDGTFDQDSQRERIKRVTSSSGKAKLIFSFDLSNATDRLPVKVQAVCLYLGGFLTF